MGERLVFNGLIFCKWQGGDLPRYNDFSSFTLLKTDANKMATKVPHVDIGHDLPIRGASAIHIYMIWDLETSGFV